MEGTSERAYIQKAKVLGESVLRCSARRKTMESAPDTSMPRRRFLIVAAFCDAVGGMSGRRAQTVLGRTHLCAWRRRWPWWWGIVAKSLSHARQPGDSESASGHDHSSTARREAPRPEHRPGEQRPPVCPQSILGTPRGRTRGRR